MKIKSNRNCYAKNKDGKMVLVNKGKEVDLPENSAKILIGLGSAVEVKSKQ